MFEYSKVSPGTWFRRFPFAKLTIISITTREIAHSKNETILTHASQKHIDKMVETAMKKGDIPGL
ncbi:hypothetical protein BUY57_12615, partial [Staphylococcus epidermidis]